VLGEVPEMHGRNTIEPARPAPFPNPSEPFGINAAGVADPVERIHWIDEVRPPTALRLITGGARHTAATATDEAPAVTEARVDTDRWINEGGSPDVETPAVLRVVT
jgi:hypothetical protein